MAQSQRDILPDGIKPIHYDLALFNLSLQEPWTYNGVVKIDAKVANAANEVVLNSKKLDIQKAIIYIGGNAFTETTNISYNADEQRATLSFGKSVPESEATIEIAFKGIMNFDMCGFYRSKYKSDEVPGPGTVQDSDGNLYMFSTQFEACDARQAFPCFDEPNLKATFDIALEIPDGQVAISNMPVKRSVEGKTPGTKLVSFDRTPPMSTYLASWAIGDFKFVETYTKRNYNGSPIPVRVYATRGLEEHGRFALEHAWKIVDLFSETFGHDYPIPKADMLAVHDFAQGAMENWGLITYRAVDVLYDPQKSDVARKNRIAYVVAHELAHQWFGNLVTMDWWDELWLNESFATWVGWWATDQLHPDWKVWDQFLSETAATAYALDSLRASHPIHVPVKDALEVDQIFDHISYSKGSAVLRMLTEYIGLGTFFKGIGIYLRNHQYKNASTNDLWVALSQASGKDISTFIDPWIRRIGFPYLTVAEEPGQIAVKQGRFLARGDVKPEEDQTLWPVPLNLRTGSEIHRSLATLSTKEETIRDINEAFYVLNAGQKAFYRTNYPPARLAKLGQAQNKLETSDKIGLINDAAAMAVSGYGTTAALLSLLENFQSEDNYMVWSSIQDAIGRTKSVFSHDEHIRAALNNFTLKLVAPAAEKIGLEFDNNDDYLTIMSRKLLLTMAANAGHESTIVYAKERFQRWQSGDANAFSQNARAFVFTQSIAHGKETEWNAIKQEFLASKDLGSKVTALAALGRTKVPDLTNNLLEMVLSEDVKMQNMPSVVASVGRNNHTRSLLWQFTMENWDWIFGRFGQNKVVLEKWFKFGFNHFSEPGMSQEMERFFSDKDIRGIDRALTVARDLIDANAQYRQRDKQLVYEWLVAHGYV